MASSNPLQELQPLKSSGRNKASVEAGFIDRNPEFLEPNFNIRLRNQMQPYLYRVEQFFEKFRSVFVCDKEAEMTTEYYEEMLEYILGTIREHEFKRTFEAEELDGMFIIPAETAAQVQRQVPKDGYDEISGLLFDIKDKGNIVLLCQLFKENVTNDMDVADATWLMCGLMNDIVTNLETGSVSKVAGTTKVAGIAISGSRSKHSTGGYFDISLGSDVDNYDVRSPDSNVLTSV